MVEKTQKTPLHSYPEWLVDARTAFLSEFVVDDISSESGDVLHEPIEAAIGLGRRMRPSLFYAFWKSVVGHFPKNDDAAVPIAIELFHAASIIVDDLADREDARRDKTPLFLKCGDDLAVLSSHALVAMGYRRLTISSKNAEVLNLWTEFYLLACIGQSNDYAFGGNSSLREQQELSLKKTEAFFGFVGASLDLLLKQKNLRVAYEAMARIFQIGNDVFDLLYMDTTSRLGDTAEYPLRLSYLVPTLVEKGIINEDEIFTFIPLERLKEISKCAREFFTSPEELLEIERQKAVNSINELDIFEAHKLMCLEFIDQCCTFSFWNHEHEK